MKKKTISLVALLLVFALLCGAYFLVLQTADAGEGEDTTAPSAQTYTILAVNVESMSALSYTTEDGELSFTMSDNAWHWQENETLPLDSGYFAAMVSALQPLTSSVKIDSPTGGQLADFGLDSPSQCVTLTDGAGEKLLFIGAYNRHNGQYYAAVNTTDTVYMIDAAVAEAFSYTIEDLIAYDLLPQITEGKLDSVSLTKGGTTVTYALVHSADTDTRIWKKEGDAVSLADETGTALTAALTALSFGKCISYDAAADAAKYGLDTPAQLTVGYRMDVTSTDMSGNEMTTEVKHSTTILVGGVDAESGCYYATVEGSTLLYLLDAPVFPTVFAATE